MNGSQSMEDSPANLAFGRTEEGLATSGENRCDFILVTPARNEAEYLSSVIESVVGSSLRPRLWLIVDDNSSDATAQIIQEATREYDFIKLARIDDGSPRDISFHYSRICVKGFQLAVEEAKELQIEWKYLALLDADSWVQKEYFESVIRQMSVDPSIGVASGDLGIATNRGVIRLKAFRDKPCGTGRIWDRRCYFDTGGYMITQSPDSVSNVVANLHGWRTERLKGQMVVQMRRTSSAEGLWKGYAARGIAAHYLGCHPTIVASNAAYYFFQLRFYAAIAYIVGYLQSFVRQSQRIDDEEVRRYYRRRRIRELAAMMREGVNSRFS